jgi:hypothetical protein
MPSAVSGKQLAGVPTAEGIRGIALFDMTGPDKSSFGWQLQVGVKKSTTEGYPANPSILLGQPGAWRFRWQVQTGTQTISCYCKQAINASPFPSMVARADSSLGLAADVTGTSGGGAGWVKIGPISVTVSGPGVLWVELRANYKGMNASSANPLGPWYPCYFDDIDI